MKATFIRDSGRIEDRKPEPKTDKLNRFHADYLRRKLSAGHGTDSLFLAILAQLSDEELIAAEAQHTRDTRDHIALMAEFRTRVSTERKDNPMARLIERCANV